MKVWCRRVVVRNGAARWRPVGALTALMLIAGLLWAPTALASTLTGHVTSAGRAVAGAFVAATGVNGQAAAVSDAGGAYSLTLPDGTYRLAGDATGFAATVVNGVTLSGTGSQDLSLTPSGAKLTPLPVFGGGATSLAADGTPGVFYFAGGNVGDLYRSLDYGGTWTQVTVSSDDGANGLPETASPNVVITSGVPGEVAVILGSGIGVFYSSDYGVTWHEVANSATSNINSPTILWGHAGSRSVLLMLTTTAMYEADMTAASPAFTQMTAPYAPPGQPVAVGDGADQPWLATVDASGNLSVYPLIAQPTAPSVPYQTLAGFPTSAVAVGIGGASGPGVPPAGVVVASTTSVTMTLKAATDTTYPAPDAAQSINCATAPGLPTSAHVTPNTGVGTSPSYGAAWFDGCWVQDAGGTVSAAGPPSTGFGNIATIDAGYDATNTSAGTDAVVLMGGTGGRGVQKLAASSGGFPVTLSQSDQATDATPGIAAGSAGIAVDGITASTVHQTALGPQGATQIASAMDVGGVASDDGGVSFHSTTYALPDSLWSVAWWQGASGSWLLYGRQGTIDLVTGFLNWTSATPPVLGGNVTGSSPSALGVTGVAGVVGSIAGVPGQDTAFLDVGSVSTDTGFALRVSLNPGPSFSNLTQIGAGQVTKPGPLVYCPTAGSASSLQDVLLVISEDTASGALYRVTGATTASPTVTQVSALPGTAPYPGRPGLDADCASGTVIAASGARGAGVLRSTDGGQTFSQLSVAPSDAIKAIALAPGDPTSLLVGTAGGYIYGSGDGGQTWVVENDPTTGQNLGGANASGGLWALVEPPASAATTSSVHLDGMRLAAGALNLAASPMSPHTAPVASAADLVAGPGEFSGQLAAPAPPPPVVTPVTTPAVPSISAFSLTHTRFRVGSKATAVTAKTAKPKPKPKPPRGSAFVYTLSAASTATIVIARESPGRLVGAACVPPTKRNAKHRRCTIYTVVHKLTPGRIVSGACVPLTKRNAKRKPCTIHTPAGTLTRNSTAGVNTVPFSGRIGSTALAVASYRATVTARIGSGAISNAMLTTFTIVRG